MLLQIAQFLALPTQALGYLFRAEPSCFEALGIQGKNRGERDKVVVYLNMKLDALLIHSLNSYRRRGFKNIKLPASDDLSATHTPFEA